ncbi:MAG: FliH/SctL family protein [Zavarzinia sp.]|nr:FliH/SctL family protein [Zavarzinia sp.]
MSNRPVKFTFDNAFDAGTPRAKPAVPPPPSFSAEDMAAARAAAFAEGEAAGRAEQAEANEARLAGASERLGEALRGIAQHLAAGESHLRADAAALGHAVARRLCETLTEDMPLAEMDAMVGHTLADLRDEPRVVIHVAGDLLESAKPLFEATAEAQAFPGRLVILGDDTMKGGDVRVEWAHGGVLRDADALSRAVESAVARYVTAHRR